MRLYSSQRSGIRKRIGTSRVCSIAPRSTSWPERLIVGGAKERVGGVVQQLYTNRVERPRPAIREKTDDVFAALLNRHICERSVGCAIDPSPDWSRASLRIPLPSNQMKVASDIRPVDSDTTDELPRRGRRRGRRNHRSKDELLRLGVRRHGLTVPPDR
jgi:hypothetical protein